MGEPIRGVGRANRGKNQGRNHPPAPPSFGSSRDPNKDTWGKQKRPSTRGAIKQSPPTLFGVLGQLLVRRRPQPQRHALPRAQKELPRRRAARHGGGVGGEHREGHGGVEGALLFWVWIWGLFLGFAWVWLGVCWGFFCHFSRACLLACLLAWLKGCGEGRLETPRPLMTKPPPPKPPTMTTQVPFSFSSSSRLSWRSARRRV
jgi:hypothetical protein